MASPLGIKIRKLRKERSFTLDKLAELTDSSKSYIWELENKDDVNPSGEKLSKLADALKVNVEFLLKKDQNHPSPNDQRETFYRRYGNLTPEKQSALNAVLDALDNESKS